MKVKILFALLFSLGMCTLQQAQAQSFDRMPAEVQKKMNENKAKGLPLTTGVWVDYELTIEGVTNAKTAAEFESFLKAECGLKSFRFDPATQHVFYTVPAEFDLDGIGPKIKKTKFGMGLFFKELYHI